MTRPDDDTATPDAPSAAESEGAPADDEDTLAKDSSGAPDPDQSLMADDGSDAAEAPEEPEVPPMLARLDGLGKAYDGHRALGPLSLDIERGCIGLLGPNGAGKSTLIRILMGLLSPSEGSVHVLGEAVSHGSSGIRRRIGYVPEGEAAFPELTGVQAVAFAGRLVGMDRASAMQRAHQVLDYVELGEARYRFVDTYSTGMRQRLKLAQALVHDPELLILDEPTEGVDPQAREDLLQLISELVRTHGLQLIISTHLLHDVERIATHAIILNKGKVVEHGPLEALRTARDRGYQVRLDADPAPLVARLDQAGIKHAWMPPVLRVQTEDAQALVQMVQDAGLTTRHVSPVELSLDEVFEEAVTRAQGWNPEDERDGDEGGPAAGDDEEDDDLERAIAEGSS